MAGIYGICAVCTLGNFNHFVQNILTRYFAFKNDGGAGLSNPQSVDIIELAIFIESEGIALS